MVKRVFDVVLERRALVINGTLVVEQAVGKGVRNHWEALARQLTATGLRLVEIPEDDPRFAEAETDRTEP